MKKAILYTILLASLIGLGSLCYYYLIAQFILSSIFILTFLFVSIKFLKPEKYRMHKIRFLCIPIIIITLCSVFYWSSTLFICSIIGSYVISKYIMNLIKSKIVKDNI